LVIDHSVQVTNCHRDSLEINVDLEYTRNKERYDFCVGAEGVQQLRVVAVGGHRAPVNWNTWPKRVLRGDTTTRWPCPTRSWHDTTHDDQWTRRLGWGVGGMSRSRDAWQALYMLMPEVIGSK